MPVELTTDLGRTLQSEITRLNRETAAVSCHPSGHWRVSLEQAGLPKTLHDVLEVLRCRVPLLQFNAGRKVRLDFKDPGQGLTGIRASQLPLGRTVKQMRPVEMR